MVQMHRLLDIGGRRLFLECAGTRTPPVVLDAGAGCANDTWDPIWTGLTELTCVCRYDRANLGQSDQAPKPRTAEDVVSDLHSLLRTAGIPSPYVMVGHSFGGLNVRLYAHRYPADVVGVVLIDSSHHDQRKRMLATLPPQVPSENEEVTRFRERLSKPSDVNDEGLDFAASQAQVSATGMLGDIPLFILSHTQASHWPPGFPPQLVTALEHSWQEMQSDLAQLSSNSRHVFAENSGHFIHWNQPNLIIDAVRQVLELIRRQP